MKKSTCSVPIQYSQFVKRHRNLRIIREIGSNRIDFDKSTGENPKRIGLELGRKKDKSKSKLEVIS